ncbi:MAG: hypothetical protein QXQ79_01340 [Candidatus Nanoarchaeia archaeon]
MATILKSKNYSGLGTKMEKKTWWLFLLLLGLVVLGTATLCTNVNAQLGEPVQPGQPAQPMQAVTWNLDFQEQEDGSLKAMLPAKGHWGYRPEARFDPEFGYLDLNLEPQVQPGENIYIASFSPPNITVKNAFSKPIPLGPKGRNIIIQSAIDLNYEDTYPEVGDAQVSYYAATGGFIENFYLEDLEPGVSAEFYQEIVPAGDDSWIANCVTGEPIGINQITDEQVCLGIYDAETDETYILILEAQPAVAYEKVYDYAGGEEFLLDEEAGLEVVSYNELPITVHRVLKPIQRCLPYGGGAPDEPNHCIPGPYGFWVFEVSYTIPETEAQPRKIAMSGINVIITKKQKDAVMGVEDPTITLSNAELTLNSDYVFSNVPVNFENVIMSKPPAKKPAFIHMNGDFNWNGGGSSGIYGLKNLIIWPDSQNTITLTNVNLDQVNVLAKAAALQMTNSNVVLVDESFTLASGAGILYAGQQKQQPLSGGKDARDARATIINNTFTSLSPGYIGIKVIQSKHTQEAGTVTLKDNTIADMKIAVAAGARDTRALTVKAENNRFVNVKTGIAAFNANVESKNNRYENVDYFGIAVPEKAFYEAVMPELAPKLAVFKEGGSAKSEYDYFDVGHSSNLAQVGYEYGAAVYVYGPTNFATVDDATIVSATSIVATKGGANSFTDQCPNDAYGPGEGAGGTGCPFADRTIVTLHKICQGSNKAPCNYAGSTKVPLDGVQVKVFNRNDPAFLATYTKNPKGELYGQIFESNIGMMSKCVTGDGVCIVGESAKGDYLVIAKYYDYETGKIVYTGLPKGYSDFGYDGVALKDLQILKTYKKDGTIQISGGSKTVILGSYLELIYPDQAIWEESASTYVYPLIMNSDEDWEVDVCAQVPEGYEVIGVYDENGNLVTNRNCIQALVAGTTTVVAFEVADVGSPKEFTATLDIVAKEKARRVKDGAKAPKEKRAKLEIPSKNKKTDRAKAVPEKAVAPKTFTGAAIAEGTTASWLLLALAGLIALYLLFGKKRKK